MFIYKNMSNSIVKTQIVRSCHMKSLCFGVNDLKFTVRPKLNIARVAHLKHKWNFGGIFRTVNVGAKTFLLSMSTPDTGHVEVHVTRCTVRNKHPGAQEDEETKTRQQCRLMRLILSYFFSADTNIVHET